MRPAFIIAAAAGLAAVTILSGPALAQANRTFVSGHGSDANPCSLSAPCRSFAGALTQTNAGGEITILDPAGYGSVTINKAVSIVNDGVGEAGVTTASATPAITISTGASDVVNLRGLTLVGGGVGVTGIVVTTGGAVNVQNCVIRGFQDGLDLLNSGSTVLNVSDTIASNNIGNNFAIQPFGSGATVTAVYNRVRAIGGNGGFVIDGAGMTGALNVTIANSAVSNTQFGITGESGAGQAVTQLMVVNTAVSNNGTAIFEDGANSTTYLARNTIAGNTTAFTIMSSGALFSFGDNDIKSNGNDGAAIPLVSTK